MAERRKASPVNAKKRVDANQKQGSNPQLAGLKEPCVRENTRRSGLLHFVCGNAQQIPFENGSFDLITISYGLRNLADWTAALAEMLRVAKPGGRLLVLDFGKPPNALWRSVFFNYLRLVVPWFGKIFCNDAQAYAYILESLRQYPAQRGVEAQMRELGCRDVRVFEFLGGIMSINYGIRP
jgi:demethylmenaquinone methyltransferase/2-methoxy-6-polyprenyl-1,4-benzoquinol methylase